MTLDDIAIKQNTDKATSVIAPGVPHGYAPHYEKFFEALRYEPVKLLEIGVGGGESILTWLEYFPNAKSPITIPTLCQNKVNSPGPNGPK